MAGTSSLAFSEVGKSKGKGREVRLYLGGAKESYSDGGFDEGQQKYSLQEDVKLSGSLITLGGSFGRYDLEISHSSLKALDVDYWESVSTNEVTFGRYFNFSRAIFPVLGVLQSTQTGDRTVSDAPPVFLHKATSLLLGMHLDWIPFAYKSVGPQFIGKYHYLTTGEAKDNYGYEYLAGGGLAYMRGKFTASLLYAVTKRHYLAAIPSETVEDAILRLSSESIGATYGLQFEYNF